MLEARDRTPSLPAPSELTAQQANLVRAVLRDDTSYLNRPHERHPTTGGRAVTALEPAEIVRFADAWGGSPVRCLKLMNGAIARLSPARAPRYLDASLDLEIRMDHEDGHVAAGEFVGIPDYLVDGYTDLGRKGKSHRQAIVVDKKGLSAELRAWKESSVQGIARETLTAPLSDFLRATASALRESLGYREERFGSTRGPGTVLLSDCVRRRAVSYRHLALLMQLMLQEQGLGSRVVKGVLRLYGLKGRHAWNLVSDGPRLALVDATFADGDAPFVAVGSSLGEVYARALERARHYEAAPDAANHYTVKSMS